MATLATQLLTGDLLQSVFGVVSVGSRTIIGYSPYGWRPKMLALPVSGFNGQRVETMTGHYHLGHGRRVYNPTLTRFHQPDSLSPFGVGGVNAYAYCMGDPINHSDPSGSAVELPDWMKQTYAPIMTIVANIFVLGSVVGTGLIAPKPMTRTAKWGVRASALGAPIAIVGASIALAHPSDEALLVGYVGTGLNGLGGMFRFGAMLQRAKALHNPSQTVGSNLRGMLGLSAKKVSSVQRSTALPVPVSVPSPSPSSSPLPIHPSVPSIYPISIYPGLETMQRELQRMDSIRWRKFVGPTYAPTTIAADNASIRHASM